LEEQLIERCAAEVELIAGSGGVFDVVAGGRKIFSKATAGRFPEEGEIVRLIEGMGSKK
jgi:selT/selW/selH-like putative selenoprotein